MIPVAGIAASKGKETAQALKNDVYVRRWASVHGKGKKAKVVEHELHVNPTGILTGVAAGVAAAGAAVLGGALALRFSGKQLKKGEAKHYFIVDTFEATSHTKIVVDEPATEGYYETYTTYIHGYPKEVTRWIEGTPAVTHEETVYDSDYVAVLLTKRGIPYGVFQGSNAPAEAVQRAVKRTPKYIDGSIVEIRSALVSAVNPITRKTQTSRRWFYEYKAKGLALEDKTEESWISKIFGVG